MSNFVLFGAAPQIVSWLTPVCLLGIGAIVGLLLLGVIYGICFGLSRIPLLGSLNESASSRNITAGGMDPHEYVTILDDVYF